MAVVRLMRRFRASAAGQDTIEYSILLGFLLLVFACLVVSETPSFRDIWNSASVTLKKGAPRSQATQGK